MFINKKYQKKTILQVVPTLISGGVEQGTVEVAKHIVQSGYNSIVISSGGSMVQSLVSSGSEHITLDVESKNPITMWKNAHIIARIISNKNIDIVHARSRAPAWSCYMATQATNTKFITTVHGVYNFNNVLKKYYNKIMTTGHRVITVSNFVKKHILYHYKVDPSTIVVIHRGVDHQKFFKGHLSNHKLDQYRKKYKIPVRTPIVLLPSRFTRWKGHITLINAIKQITNLNFICIMVGNLANHPRYVSVINQIIHQNNLQKHIKLFDHETDIINLYAISDIVLSTSVEPEAFGRTIIEAQAMEKIVIATSIGGAYETICHGVDGFHVKPNDSHELAQRIESCLLLLGSKIARNITSNARERVSKHFSLQAMLDNTLHVYNLVKPSTT